MDVIDSSQHPHMETSLLLRLIFSLGIIAACVHILGNYNLNAFEHLSLGVLLGGLLFYGNLYVFHKPSIWFHCIMYEYIYKPIIISRKVDSVTASDVREQVRMLWNDSGWERTVGVDSWIEDNELYIRFVRGNCFETFSVRVKNITVRDNERLFGFIFGLEDTCFCCEDDNRLYKVKSDVLSGAGNYVKECYLCEDCLDDVMKSGLNDLDSELYVDIAAENM